MRRGGGEGRIGRAEGLLMPEPLDDSSLPDAESHHPAVYMVFSVALRIVGVVRVVLTLLDRRVLVSFEL
jgi:hypothetical protein